MSDYVSEILEKSLRSMLGEDYDEKESVFHNLGRAEMTHLILKQELKTYKEIYDGQRT